MTPGNHHTERSGTGKPGKAKVSDNSSKAVGSRPDPGNGSEADSLPDHEPGFLQEYVSMHTGLIHPQNHWEPVNDTVMGGRSHASAVFNASERLIMHGHLSLENNGGFASVRTRHNLNLAGFDGFRLHLTGDGKRYCFRIKTKNGNQLHPFSYEACFDTRPLLTSTGGEQQKSETGPPSQPHFPPRHQLSTVQSEWVDVAFDRFRPVFRGRYVPDAPPLNPSEIGEVALMIKERQEGPFHLQVNDITGYRHPHADEREWMEMALAEADESGTPYGATIPDVTAAGGKQIDLRAKLVALHTPDSPVLFEGLCREACRQRVDKIYS